MAEEEAKKVEPESTSEAAPEPVPTPEPEPSVEAPADVAVEKSIVPTTEEKPDDSKALVVVEQPAAEVKPAEGSVNRDAVLARVATEKKDALIRAWEESEKSKAENKAQKKMSAIVSWENTEKASIEAEIKKMEEKLEKKKAVYVEKMKNKLASIHKTAEEKRAMTEAKKGEDLLKAEEMAAKYRATGTGPKKGWFSSWIWSAKQVLFDSFIDDMHL